LSTPEIDTGTLSELELSFKHSVNYFSGPYTLMVQTFLDGENSWNTEWQEINPLSNIPSETVEIDLDHLAGETIVINLEKPLKPGRKNIIMI